MEVYFDSSMRIDQINNEGYCFVDRDIELMKCINSILVQDKAIIIGERGVGKSALIKRVEFEIKRNYDNILPLYIRFSPIMHFTEHDSHLWYVYHLIISVVQYTWTVILGNKLTDLYNDSLNSSNDFSRQVQAIHRLTRLTRQNVANIVQREYGAAFYVKGNSQNSQEYKSDLNPLSLQEMSGLFVELCNGLKEYCGIDQLAFLVDEANLLSEEKQLEIEMELSNIFPILPCSFLYVASVSSYVGQRNPHTEFFSQVIFVEGFKSIDHSKQLIQSRILQKDKVEINDQVYEVIHNTAKGNPRYLITIMQEIVNMKLCAGNEIISVSLQDAQDECQKFLETQERNKRILSGEVAFKYP